MCVDSILHKDIKRNVCACVCPCPQADFSQGGMEGGDGGQVNATTTVEHNLMLTPHLNDIHHKYDDVKTFSLSNRVIRPGDRNNTLSLPKTLNLSDSSLLSSHPSNTSHISEILFVTVWKTKTDHVFPRLLFIV